MGDENKEAQNQSTTTEPPKTPSTQTETESKPKTPDAADDKKGGEGTPNPDQSAAKKDETGAKAVPEKYELKLPEKSQLSPARIEKIEAYAKAQGLSKEQAQALVENEHAAVATFVEEQSQMVESVKEGWKNELLQDKDLGGEAFQKNAELAKRGLKVFADDALLDELDRTGLGNHPGFFRMCVKLGKAVGEDGMIRGGAPVAAAKKKPEEILYGGTPSN